MEASRLREYKGEIDRVVEERERRGWTSPRGPSPLAGQDTSVVTESVRACSYY